jgi:hypothetical protein
MKITKMKLLELTFEDIVWQDKSKLIIDLDTPECLADEFRNGYAIIKLDKVLLRSDYVLYESDKKGSRYFMLCRPMEEIDDPFKIQCKDGPVCEITDGKYFNYVYDNKYKSINPLWSSPSIMAITLEVNK